MGTTGSHSDLQHRLECHLKQGSGGSWMWETLPDLPVARFGASLVEWMGGLYLFGGYGVDGSPSSQLFYWNHALDDWKELHPTGEQDLPKPLYHHSAGILPLTVWMKHSTGCEILFHSGRRTI